MEGRTVIIGDHTGLLRILKPSLTTLGSPGENLSILNIFPRNDELLIFRQNGSIELINFDGSISVLKSGSKKILDGFSINDTSEVLAYSDGSFECEGVVSKCSIPKLRGIFVDQSLLALCGNANAEIWDIAEGKSVWKARTIKPREEVFDSKCFMVENCVYVGTTKNEVKMYDIRAAKKHVKYLQMNPEGHIYHFPVSSLFVKDRDLVVGDSIGHVYKVSTNEFRVQGKTKTRSVGAISSIFVKDEEIYSCGLDRRLMIHDRKSMQFIAKHYLWQKLNKVIVL